MDYIPMIDKRLKIVTKYVGYTAKIDNLYYEF